MKGGRIYVEAHGRNEFDCRSHAVSQAAGFFGGRPFIVTLIDARAEQHSMGGQVLMWHAHYAAELANVEPLVIHA